MAVIAINKILDKVWAKYLPGAKVPFVVIAAEMWMFPINQVSTHIWAQALKSILKGKVVDPLEHGGAMEAGGSKVEGKQVLDCKQGGNGGERGKKKKEKKEKNEKKIERLAKGSDGCHNFGAVGVELGGPIAGEDSGAGTAEETRGRSQERKPKKQLQTQSHSLVTSKVLVTPPKRAPSLGPGPLTSKKTKASVSKLRPKTPLVTQKAKFTNDVGVTPSESIKVYHPLAGPPPQSIPQASAINLIATPVNPLLDA
ncbi:hypothetical protein PAXRUDRAFT_12339 [Paxillus rubicundulus Ve08.2h10]|uniref:Uncharacterized protein n=1 Tax=Paxillus rubicundulus Ve08.2h10 TaxID=930991 RepID=A0A0D0DW47_9AGAM|nr:hypothetical protein PAXRUDRAFT_12339 [Paxillus rubicundulus Ve08.2h10]